MYLYLEPIPHEGNRLRFELAEATALGVDGGSYPLTLMLSQLNGEEVKRQRFLAYGQLPPGTYRGIALTVKKAELADESGTAALMVPERPVEQSFHFVVNRQKATVVTLSLNPGRSLSDGFRFTPNFVLNVPPRPVIELTGYVSNSRAQTVTVFDKQRKEVVGVIATGRNPRGMAIDQQRRRAYVALAGDHAIEVLDIAVGEVTNRIPLNSGDAPQELALTPNGQLLVVVDGGTNMVSFVDPLSYLELDRIPVDPGPSSVLIDPSGRFAYVFSSLTNTVTLIDIARRAVLAKAATEPGPTRGAFNRRGDGLYLIHEMSSYLGLVDPTTLAERKRTYTGMGLSEVIVDPATDLIYAARRRSGEVDLFEPLSLLSFTFIPVGGEPLRLAIDGDENLLYVVNASRRTLQVVNLVSKRLVAEIDVDLGPYWVTMMGER